MKLRTAAVLAVATTLVLSSYAQAVTLPVIKASDAARLSQSMPRSIHSGESTYFLLTDRYANGDPSNDSGSGRSAGGFDPTKSTGFHGGDFVGLMQNLERIKTLGFTAIWVTPPVMQNAVQAGTSAYHGYWGLDFTTTDPHWGTEAEFKAMVDRAHELGIKVIMDIVVNHTGDVISYQGGNYDFRYTSNYPYKDSDGTPADITKLNGKALCANGAITNCFPDFTTSGFPYVPIAGAEKGPAFLNDITLYHNRGDANRCGWAEGECAQMGDFFGLDDVMTEDPRVVDGWATTYGEWVSKFGVDGFRIDTAKHTDDKFFPRWLAKFLPIAAGAGKTDFTMYGEAWYETSTDLIRYAVKSRLMSLLDFPSRKVIAGFAAGSTVANGAQLLNIVKYDDLYNLGGTKDGVIRNAYNLTTFIGNHDEGRGNSAIATRTSATGATLVEKVNLGNSVLFLMRGSPTVYYGDEIGMISSGGDSAARQDMLPTQVPSWQTQMRIGSSPIGNGSGLDPALLGHPIASHITALQTLRAAHPALANGAFIPRQYSGMLASWSRVSPTDRYEYVVVMNGADVQGTIKVNTSTPSSQFAPLFGTQTAVTSSSTGSINFTVPARTAMVFKAVKQLPGLTKAPVLKVIGEPSYKTGTALLRVATPAVKDPISVTFVARTCTKCAWFRIGTDDAAPFQIPVMPEAWAGKTSLQFAAISRTSNGKIAGGPIVTIIKKKVLP